MVIEGMINNHGNCPNTATSKGLVHNKTNVAETMSCIQFQQKLNSHIGERNLELKKITLSATGSKKAPNVDFIFICIASKRHCFNTLVS